MDHLHAVDPGYPIRRQGEEEIFTFLISSKKLNGMRKIVKQVVGIVMEATGVYHESLAYYLNEKELEVSVILPNKISNYFRTLNVKTSTDKTASEAIAQFGLERKIDQWKRPRQIFKSLKQLTRERDQIVEARTMAKNQLHAENTEAFPNPRSLARIKSHIKFLDKQVAEILKEITASIKLRKGK